MCNVGCTLTRRSVHAVGKHGSHFIKCLQRHALPPGLRLTEPITQLILLQCTVPAGMALHVMSLVGPFGRNELLLMSNEETVCSVDR